MSKLIEDLTEKDLVLFDFDGTITHKDSLFEFLKYYRGSFHFYAGMAILLPVFILYFLKFIPNWRAKEFVFTFFLRNEPLSVFNKKCDQFSLHRIASFCRQPATEQLQLFKSSGIRIIIVSASVENWIAKWAEGYGIEVVGTKLEVKDEKLTGKILGKNCHGIEKVNRIREYLDLDSYERVIAFGDTSGDQEMLKLSNRSYYRYFE